MSDFISANETNYSSDQLLHENRTLSDQILTFDLFNRNGKKIFSLFITGIVSSVGVISMLIWLFTKNPAPGDSLFPGIIGGLSVIPIFAFVGVFFLMRTARQVILDFDVIIINGYGWSKRLKYESVAKIDHRRGDPNNPLSPADLLLLFDWNGKVIGRIPMKITDFNILETELLRRIQNATGEKVYDRQEELIEKRRKKKRQQRLLALGFGLMFLCQFIGFLWGYYDYAQKNQFQKSSVSIEAVIKRHYLFNGRGRRLEYVFTINGKEYTKEVLLYERDWADLKEAKNVTVRYLPSNPNINQPEQGEDRIDMSMLLGICPFGIVLFGILFVFSILGYDFESHNGTMYLLKPGQILEDRLDESSQCSDK